MKKENRLKKRKQFKWTFKNGQAQSSKHLTMIFVDSKARDVKIGFSVTKKVGNAVVRNRKKRQLREAVTHLLPNIKNCHTIIFVAKPNIVNASFAEIEEELMSLLKKANLQRDER